MPGGEPGARRGRTHPGLNSRAAAEGGIESSPTKFLDSSPRVSSSEPGSVSCQQRPERQRVKSEISAAASPSKSHSQCYV